MTGKYRAYPEYKDSGVEWLGEIPAHWTQVPFKRVCSLKTGLTPPTDNQANYVDEENDKPWVRPEDLKENGNVITASKFLSQSGWELMRIVPPYSTLICCIGTIGKTGYVGSEVSSNQQITSASFNSSPRFNYYLIQSAKEVLEETATGNVIQILNSERLGGIGFLSVPEMEANRIANFLDHETAKIDTLIEKQQRLIKLLKEKRQAVISHAVTKGLNPNVPMRDSGVEWLGEVPEHWRNSPLKHVSTIKYGIGEPPKYVEEGVSLIRATNIRSGKVSKINLVFVNPDDIPENRIVWLEEGDIIVVRSGAGTGDSAIIPNDYEGSIAGFDMVVKPVKCSPEFLGHALLSNYIRNNQIDLEKTRAAQPHLNAEELGDCFVLLPPQTEQLEIVKHIDYELFKFDHLIQRAEKAIELMKERRTALISAAVTGKINVTSLNNYE